MKVSLEWVSDYVDLPEDVSSAELAHELTLKTVEVEDIIDLGANLARVVAGVVESVTHLSERGQAAVTCRTGPDSVVSVITAPSNLEAGTHVAVALPGARLINGATGEIRVVSATTVSGQPSEAVICTPTHLGLQRLFPHLSPSAYLDLADLGAPAGAPLAPLLGLDDVILEIDNKSLTNRPDLWGQYGIARELATIYDTPLRRLPSMPWARQSTKLIGEVDRDVCSRFAAVSFEIGDPAAMAPLWLRSRLFRIGEASINLCVDLSNYVMFTTGQPNHVYDADRISLPLSVRNSDPSVDHFVLLDGTSVRATPATSFIEDTAGPVGLAGIMGGMRSAVGRDTRRYVLEAATFRARPVRRTAQRLGLRTEASARYEKALDTPRVDAAVGFLLYLLGETAPDAVVTAAQDVTLDATSRAEVTVGLSYLANRIGIDIDVKEIERILDSLGFSIDIEDDVMHAVAPSWRSTGDISLPQDIVEEIARIYGYDNLPVVTPAIELQPVRALGIRPVDRIVRETLATRLGLHEVVTYPWTSDAMLSAAGWGKAETVQFEGAPAPDRDSLRPSLVPNLIEATAENLRYSAEVEIFEVGTVFSGGPYVPYGDDFEPMPRQTLMLAGILTGSEGAELFRRAKGILEELSRSGHLTPLGFASEDVAPWADASARTTIMANAAPIGTLGLLTKRAIKLAGINATQVACFELRLDKISAHTSRDNTFEPLPELPEADFDLSVVIADSVRWSEIAPAAEQADPLVHSVSFVDEFRGPRVPEGHRSVTLRVTLRPKGTTLTTEMISASRSRVISALADQVGATLRA